MRPREGASSPVRRCAAAIAVAGALAFAVGHRGADAVVTRASVARASSAANEVFLPHCELRRGLPAPADLTTACAGHTATVLADGRILVTGGSVMGDDRLEIATGSVEILDPGTGRWTAGPSLSVPRTGHAAALLRDGRLLVAGGFTDRANGTRTRESEVIEADASRTSVVSPMAVPRANPCMERLRDGRVIVVGGEDVGPSVTSRLVEAFDPVVGSWSPVATAPAPVYRSACALLGDGRLLLAGGWTGSAALDTSALYDPRADTWRMTENLKSPRAAARMALLADGRVLLVGGSSGGPGSQAELFDPLTAQWSAVPAPLHSHDTFALTRLGDGSALLTGGAFAAEVFDPGAAAWSSVGRMRESREQHAVVASPDGGAVAVGGRGTHWVSGSGRGAVATSLGGLRPSAERLDPTTGAWSSRTVEKRARWFHTATPLADGRILIAGGVGAIGPMASAAIYSPETGHWSAANAMAAARSDHTATRLVGGQVLVAGGRGSDGMATARAEVFSPTESSWRTTASMLARRHGHAAAALSDGRVLVVGGAAVDGLRTDPPVPAAEAYDPIAGTWHAVAAPTVDAWGRALVALRDGTVLAIGGYDLATYADSTVVERYDPRADAWTTVAPLPEGRFAHAAALLPDGRVLTSGGTYVDDRYATRYRSSSAIYDPATGFWWSTETMTDVRGRSRHTLSVLDGGRVLACGDEWWGRSSAEILDLGTGEWRRTAAMAIGRMGHTATALADGRILVMGGYDSSLAARQATIEAFDPAVDAWQTIGVLPPGGR